MLSSGASSAFSSDSSPDSRDSPDARDSYADSRLLWRLDSEGGELQLLIVSGRQPSLEHVQEQAGWATEITWESRRYEHLLSRLSVGQRYAFRLTANPVHTVTDDSGRKRLRAHVSARHQLDWLASRADSLGVRFLTESEFSQMNSHLSLTSNDAEGGSAEPSRMIRVSARETLHFRRGEQRVTIARARFDGALEVTNAALLRAALTQGIGRAKAYGCGLMTLAPTRIPVPSTVSSSAE